MNWLVLRAKYRALVETSLAQKLFELGLSLLVGLMVGALLIFSWRLPSKWQEFIVVIPVVFVFVMLINDLEKIVLAAIAINVPFSFDVSLIISPYARIPENVTRGHLTIVALTELRLTLVMVMLVIGYALWIIGPRGPDRKPVRFFAGTSVPALALIFFTILSTFQSQDLQLSFFRWVQLLELFLTYFYLANHIRTIQDIKFFVMVLMWGLLAESILMIWQWVTGLSFAIAGLETSSYEYPLYRVGGTLGNPNVAGGILSAHLAIVGAMMWIFPKWSQKVFAVLCFVLGGIAMIGTASRASWGSFVMALLGFVLIGLWRGWVRREALILLLIAALVMGIVFYQPIYTRLTADDQGSAESRTKMARLAWNVIQAHLWWGVGTNNYALVAHNYYTSNVGDLGIVVYSSVHNRYLLLWAETGLLGLLSYLSFLLAPLIQAWQHIRSDDRFRSPMALGLGCAIGSMSIQMLAEHFSPRPSALFVWLLVSLVASLRNLESGRVESLVSEQV